MHSQPEVIEPEILDENGQPIAAPVPPGVHGDVYGKVGVFAGLFALIFSVIIMLLGVLVTVFVIAPLLLLGRLFGLQMLSIRSRKD